MASYVINKSPQTTLEGKVPKKVWTWKSVDHSSLRVFSCLVYIHISSMIGQSLTLNQSSVSAKDMKKEINNISFRIWQEK